MRRHQQRGLPVARGHCHCCSRRRRPRQRIQLGRGLVRRLCRLQRRSRGRRVGHHQPVLGLHSERRVHADRWLSVQGEPRRRGRFRLRRLLEDLGPSARGTRQRRDRSARQRARDRHGARSSGSGRRRHRQRRGHRLGRLGHSQLRPEGHLSAQGRPPRRRPLGHARPVRRPRRSRSLQLHRYRRAGPHGPDARRAEGKAGQQPRPLAHDADLVGR